MTESGFNGNCAAARAVARELEYGIPLVEEPFGDIGERLGLPHDSVIDYALDMFRSGLMRRFGVFFDYRKLGYEGWLFGVSSTPENPDEMTEYFCSLPYVTHVYRREHELDLWFTALSIGEENISPIIGHLKGERASFVALRAAKVIKLRPSFIGNEPGVISDMTECELPDGHTLSLAKRAEKISFISKRPFAYAAELSGISETELLRDVRDLSSRGIIRRVGASFDHYMAGWRANALCAFEIPEIAARTESIRSAVKNFPWVSHCYVRELIDCGGFAPRKWSYNLYVMIHAHTGFKLAEQGKLLCETFRASDFVSLKTVFELKKARIEL